MEPDAILIINSDKKYIKIYGDRKIIIPFDRYYLLELFLKDRKFIILEKAQTVSFKELTSRVAKTTQPDLNVYLRYKGKGSFKIDELKLVFSNDMDCKPVKKIGFKKLLENGKIADLIANKIIQVITEEEALDIKSKKSKAGRERAIDSIVLNRSAHDAAENSNSMFDDDENDVTDQEVEMESDRLIRELGIQDE